MKQIRRIALLLLVTLFTGVSAFAENASLPVSREDPFVNLVFGVSSFLGVIGAEYQDVHHAYGIGLPGRISYRYFDEPYADSSFLGLYIGTYTITDADEVYQGVFYRKVKSSYLGAGAGYRWLWASGFNVTTSIALEYFKDEYSNSSSNIKGTDTGFFPFPGINIGYKF